MHRLSPDLRRVAALIATGQVLLVAPGAPAPSGPEIFIMPDPTPKPDLEKLVIEMGSATTGEYQPPIQREREPWRRGRPLR